MSLVVMDPPANAGNTGDAGHRAAKSQTQLKQLSTHNCLTVSHQLYAYVYHLPPQSPSYRTPIPPSHHRAQAEPSLLCGSFPLAIHLAHGSVKQRN